MVSRRHVVTVSRRQCDSVTSSQCHVVSVSRPHDALDPVEVVRDARVDAGHGRAAAAPERRDAHEPVEAVAFRQPLQRPTRVALPEHLHY